MDWSAAEAKLETAAASVFDNAIVTIEPRKEGISVNQPRVADPSRASFDGRGTIETGVPALPASGRFSADASAKAMPVTFEAVLTAYVAGWPYVPVRGDRVVAGTKSYDIMNVDRDGTSRAVFHLNASR